MNNSENILEIAKLKPDFLGFIFWEKSARYFDGIIPNLPKSIAKVGVFVDASVNEIMSKVIVHNLEFIQLHGNESAEFCKNVKSKLSENKIIKAFAIDSEFDFAILKEYALVCDYFLFDTKGKLPGGNGTAFDWNLLKNYSLDTPFFLSGGIGLQDIKKIKEFKNSVVSNKCFALDVNSKFEINPGLKNEKELSLFKKLLHEN